MYRQPTLQHKGFTIVELLIVIVVIAILAAITIVAYNGISNQAKEAALKSDLINGAKQLGITKVETGNYPQDDSALKKSDDIAFQYSASINTFCLTATSSDLPGKAFHITESSNVQTNFCPNHIAIAGSMQTFTPAQCSSLAIYNGSNTNAVIGLTDSRGGAIRTYHVAKLADNKCWMLTNLRLGSTVKTITLTPSDSDIAANFILPQLTTSGTNEHDLPRVYGPVPGDNNTNDANYGYLYNFSAATAGESRISLPAGSGAAPHSICPTNWRLPSGGVWNDTTNELSILNARMNNLNGVTDPGYTNINFSTVPFANNWLYTGPLKGALSGGWVDGSFIYQGTTGILWSRTASVSIDNAYYASFTSSFVYPTHSPYRYHGLGLRCILK